MNDFRIKGQKIAEKYDSNNVKIITDIIFNFEKYNT